MNALVTGATGFIGRRLVERLDRPTVLSRDADRAAKTLSRGNLKAAYTWDPMSGPPPREAFDGIDAVFHLAGEPIAEGRWTAAKKRRIRDSRVTATRNLVEGLRSLDRRPPVLVSVSAVGYYGSRGDEVLDESASPGNDFLAQVCIDWEQAASAATGWGIRVVNPRFGVVLGDGGALAKMLLPFKLGLGGPLGNGKHWMAWIHRDDVVSLLLHAAAAPDLSGPLNAVAPAPVTNREFTKELAAQLHRPAFLPAPYLGLRLLFGEVATVLFSSQRAVPKAAEESGFQFRYPQLSQALAASLHQDGADRPAESFARVR